ncbi:MAG: hypothetical protein H7Z16_10965 [Pyrinomonadaceae bacterium]|nr:hypothetical protein [Pyrinomonadaceae bacterium]
MKPKLPDLRLDRRKFTRTEDPELHGYSYYTNEEDGVTYSISDRRVVIGIDWFGTARDAKTLRCPTVRPPFATENAPFDRASVGVTLEEDKPRLKQFAENLKKALGTKGYVIAYGGELGPARVAKMRLKCIRDYLQKTHQIKPSRLVMLDGGYRAEISVDLFLVRVGDPIPKPAPTRYPVAVRDVPPRTNPC